MTDAVPTLYVNGRFVSEAEARLSPLDRGFTLADGLFETMVALDDRVFRMEGHLARMRRGAETLHLPLPPSEELAGVVLEAIRRNGYPRSVARLTVSRGVDHGRGLDVSPGIEPSVVVRVTPWQGPLDSAPPGRSLASSTMLRNDRSPLSRVKSLSYVEGVAARLAAQRAGADDALLRNTRGFVAGGTSSNVFIAAGGRLLTPPEEDGALPGMARLTVLEEASRLGILRRRAVAGAGAGRRRGGGVPDQRGPGPGPSGLVGRPTHWRGRAGGGDAEAGSGLLGPGEIRSELTEDRLRRCGSAVFSQHMLRKPRRLSY